MRRFDRAQVVLVVSLVGSLLLYLAGFRSLLLAACVAAGVLLLPVTAVTRSLAGRLFLSVLVFFSVFQAAATLQFLLLPDSRFEVAAAITAGGYLLAALLVDRAPIDVPDGVGRLWNRNDSAAAIVAAIFLLPFAPVLLGSHAVTRVAQMGGGQAKDGINHLAGIADMGHAQHMTYVEGSYYPQGFHITVAFLQDALSLSPAEVGWEGSVFLFMGQYLVSGILLACAMGYLLSSVVGAFSRRTQGGIAPALLYAAGIATGAVAGPFVLWPFVHHGFLNYYYAIAAILMAFAVLLTGSRQRLFPTVGLFLGLVFGAGVSWPLLIPPLLVTLALFLVQPGYLRLLRDLPVHQLVVLGALVAMQFVPIVFQLAYSGAGASQGINLPGGLAAFHPLSLLLSAAIVLAFAASRSLDRELKERGLALVLPLLGFIGVLALMQLFVVGEVRYYVIKSAFLLETLNVVLLAGLAALALSALDMAAVAKFFAVAVVPSAIVFSVLAVTSNPLADVRNLFRTEAGQVKPDFFDDDLATYARLGTSGDVHGFHTTVLHYDPEWERYSAHMQIPFWVNMLQYDGSEGARQSLAYNGELYNNLTLGTATEAEQQRLVRSLAECAQLARDRGEEYIIVTDPRSVSVIEEEFGELVRIETYEHH